MSLEVVDMNAFIKMIILKITANPPEIIANVPMSGRKAKPRFSMQNMSKIFLNIFHRRDNGRVEFMPIFYFRNKQLQQQLQLQSALQAKHRMTVWST